MAITAAATIVLAFPAYEHNIPWQLPEEPVRVLFVGDLMLDRNVARSAEEEGVAALFATSTLELFKDADLRVANLEGTITNNPSIARRDNSILRFTFDPTIASEVLRLLGLEVVSLANNHALDFGEFGYDDTLAELEKLGIHAFGQPFNDKGRLSTTVMVKDKQLCFIGYHSLFASDYSAVVAEIARLRPDCWRLVVVPHWGEEYVAVSNTAQQEAGHAFIDAGADLVIGAHPHVVQNVETYQGKGIFYSLGNFMFDQNFSWGTTHSLAVRADFYEDKIAFTLVPLTIAEQYSSVASGADRERILGATGQVAEFQLP